MQGSREVETLLADSLLQLQMPTRILAAMHAAVFPAGARLRPQLCLAVAYACADGPLIYLTEAAAAVELLHCASLVHDDLPCFDNGRYRRGLPSIHCQFGENLAVLAGDGLIVLAFRLLGNACQPLAEKMGQIAADAALRLIGGQAQELEPNLELNAYHRGKTAALFEAATMLGALVAGCDALPWQTLGKTIGEAYQLADDLLDAHEDQGNTNAIRHYGLLKTQQRLLTLLAHARQNVPVTPSRLVLQWLDKLESRLVAACVPLASCPSVKAF